MITDLHDILFLYQTIPPITASRDDNDQKQYDIPLQLVGLDNNGVYTAISAGISVKGASEYNLRSDAAVISATIENQDKIKSYNEIQLAIDEVSSKYQNQLGLDDNAAETVTRINAHHFGFPGKGLQAPAFMKASTNSPYFEGATCSIIGLPKSGYILVPPPQCKLRIIRHYSISRENELNLIFPDLIMNHNNTLIDFGHTIVGLNFLLHENRNAAPAAYLQDLGIDKGLDLVSFLGDISSALAAAYAEDSNPSNSLIDAKYSSVFPQANLYGDIDAFGLKSAYDEVLTNEPNALFSRVFEHYYGSTIPPSPITHYTKRFTNFATEWGLIDGQGNWLGNSFPHYSDWVQRIKDLYPFLYKALYEDLGWVLLGYEVMNDYQSSNSDFSGIPSLSNSDAIYALDKFLQSLQTGYNNE